MENFEEKACLCALNRIFGFEPKSGLALIEFCGCASNIFRLDENEINQLLGPFSKHRGKINEKAVEMAAKELNRLESNGIIFCGTTEEHYPASLKECDDPPIGLYIKSSSDIQSLWKDNSIAVVGTRDISPYGREWCERIIQGLSLSGASPLIISGLALGTDIVAHRSALEYGLPTIGVMATGADKVYPSRHRDFAHLMASAEGSALITDYPPETAPLAIHFLRRNRIIAGLSRAIILIESKIRGGGMMTCRLGFSYNRDIYCLPGRIDDIRSQGCNELIRQKVAEPITSVEQLMENLGMNGYRPQKKDIGTLIRMTYSERVSTEDIETMIRLIEGIRGHTGITIEELADATGADYNSTFRFVNMLEIDGFITTDLLQRCSIKIKKM